MLRRAATFLAALLCLAPIAARAADVPSAPADKTDDARAEADLQKPVPETTFKDAPLGDVVDRLAKIAHANLYIDLAALQSPQIHVLETKINLRAAPNTRLEAVLKDLVVQLRKDEHPGAFAACGAVIVISTQQGAKDFVERHRKALAKAKGPDGGVLAMNVAKLSPTDRTFGAAIEKLRDVPQKGGIFVDWKSLKAARVFKESPVSVRLRNVSLAQALQLLLDECQPTKPVDFEMRGEDIYISTVPEPKEGL